MSYEEKNIPAEITRRLLDHGNKVASSVSKLANEFSKSKEKIRSDVFDHILEVDNDILDNYETSTVTAVDGSIVCDSKSIGDLCSVVGVSVSSDESKQLDPEIYMEMVPRSVKNKDIIGGIMSSMEVKLAANSETDVVLIDGSLMSTMLNIANGIMASRNVYNDLSKELKTRISDSEFYNMIMKILTSNRYVAMPKYTTTNEFSDFLSEEFNDMDAKTLMTLALKPGEMTVFQNRKKMNPNNPDKKFLAPNLGFSKENQEEFTNVLENVVFSYYRPHPWTPAFRLDMCADAINDNDALLRALKTVRDTTMVSGVREPFPLYLVDVFAKNISDGTTPVIDMALISEIEDPEMKLLLAMKYRT